MSDFTKSNGQLMDWTVLDDTGATPTTESGELDSGEGLDSAMEAVLHIDMAHADTNAAGNAAYVKVWIKSGTTDEDWHLLTKVQATGGTANAGDIDAESASAQANLYLTSTTNFENPGDVYIVKDVDAVTNSQLVINKDFVNDDYVILCDNLVNTFSTDDYAYDIVDQWNIPLPAGVQSAKVTFHNEDADATYLCRVRYTMVTDIE